MKRRERPGHVEKDAIWPLLDLDDEVIRTWDLFDTTPTEASASALAGAVERDRGERMRLVP